MGVSVVSVKCIVGYVCSGSEDITVMKQANVILSVSCVFENIVMGLQMY